MKFNTKQVLQILGSQVVKNNTKECISYEWLDVVHVTGNPDTQSNKLIFASYEEPDNWHFGFDRRGKFIQYAENNHVIVDFDTDEQNTIVVTSTSESSKLLYAYVSKNPSTNPFTF